MFTIGEIVNCSGGTLVNGDIAAKVSGISIDSRTIRPGELFLAIRGRRFDGHEYVSAGIEQMAAGVVVSREWFDKNREKISVISAPVVVVEDTVIALGYIAAAHRKKFNIPVIAVTGSNGKTTTKEIIAAVLGLQYNVLKNEGSFNNPIGVPLTLLKLNSSHTAAVFELGMNHKGEIRSLAALVRPTIAVITNAAEAHLEFFNGVDDIIDAKLELLEKLPVGAHAFVNADYPRLYEKAQDYAEEVIGFGIEKNCRYRASNVITQNDGVVFTVNEKYTFKLPLLGEHNVYNALAAVAVAECLGIEAGALRGTLASLKSVLMRMQPIRFRDITIIADCYNANPHSAEAAIRALAGMKNGARKIFVLADMLELGKGSESFHAKLGELIAVQHSIAILVSVGKRAAAAAYAAESFGMPKNDIFVCETNETALKVLKPMLQPGDIVLFKGSRGMRLESIINEIIRGECGTDTLPIR